MTDISQMLQELLLHHTPGPGRAWFEPAVFAARSRWDRSTFLASFAAATLRLGKDPLPTGAAEVERLRSAGIDQRVNGWERDELGRAVLLLIAATQLPDAELEELVEDCYSHGENRERQAVLRALPLLPRPERFLRIAVDACRSSVQPVFEAIACENGYPAAYFPELNFNQMILKALFVGLALERVVGLAGRVTPTLVRMATDYASERRAAGRPVPIDIERFITRSRSAS
jgi:hypothetical protein